MLSRSAGRVHRVLEPLWVAPERAKASWMKIEDERVFLALWEFSLRGLVQMQSSAMCRLLSTF